MRNWLVIRPVTVLLLMDTRAELVTTSPRWRHVTMGVGLPEMRHTTFNWPPISTETFDSSDTIAAPSAETVTDARKHKHNLRDIYKLTHDPPPLSSIVIISQCPSFTQVLSTEESSPSAVTRKILQWTSSSTFQCRDNEQREVFQEQSRHLKCKT